MNKTKIPWCDFTWNPITGCDPVSEGCEHCYARAMAVRFQGGDNSLRFHPDRIGQPAKVKKPSRIFVCSTSDFWHQDIHPAWTLIVLGATAKAPQHTYIILTKRPQNIPTWFTFSKNVWLGVTAENQARADERIPILISIPAAVRFVSVEPMLEPMDLTQYLGKGLLDWVIAGPETGPGARVCDWDWIEDLYDQCKAARVPSFFDKRVPWLRREWPA